MGCLLSCVVVNIFMLKAMVIPTLVKFLVSNVLRKIPFRLAKDAVW